MIRINGRCRVTVCACEDGEAAAIAAGANRSSIKAVNIMALARVVNEESGIYMYLGAFPAQPRQVSTVRPPMQDMCSGSRLKIERFVLAIVDRWMADGSGARAQRGVCTVLD